MFFIYILRSIPTRRYCVGSTENVDERLVQHNAGKSKSTRAGIPWELIHTEAFETRSAAVLREQKIKARGIGRYLAGLQNPETG